MELIEKYNVPGPRYTSYPTVPYWDNPPTESEWKALVKASFNAHNDADGISIYIHLPYCESLCTFCGCTTRITVNHQVERPYIDALLAEWRLYTDLFGEKPKVKEIHLGGGTPTFFSPHHLSELINGIRHTADLDEHASLGLEANPRTTTYEHLVTLSELGFKRLSLGVQDFDPVVQQTINRVQSFAQVKTVTDWARSLGYESINFDVVYGLPFQTERSIEHTMDLVNLLRPDRIAYYSYAHVPWVKPGQRSFTEQDLPAPALKHKLYSIGKCMLSDAGYVEIGMDHFSLPEEELTLAYQSGKLHRNFMGYTTQPSKLMIGLGLSAISDTWTGFAQNIKAVEPYIERVSSGEFPIFRGHKLNREDLMIRQLILNIMCQFRTAVDNEHAQNLKLLSEMEADQLLRIADGALHVTSAGRPFVRNICMAFDQRMRRSRPETQIFSMTV